MSEVNDNTRERSGSEDAVPVCLGCLRPVSPLQHYCAHCGSCVGQLTPYLPFEQIPYYAGFFGRLWKRVWLEQGTRAWRRVGYFVLMAVLEPVMLLALVPLAFRWRRWYRAYHRLCLRCGYDLRGSRHSEVCPECGEAVVA
jgi:predicted amidophosphoribosyltransferase